MKPSTYSLRQQNESASLVRGRRRITWSEYGEPAGFAVLWCHQPGGSRLEAGLLHEEALRQGVRLIAVDRPGVGGTHRAMDPAAAVVDDALAVLDRLGVRRFGLIGWSGGTAHALAMAARRPDSAAFCLCLGGAPLCMVGRRTSRRAGWLRAVLRSLLYWRCRLTALTGGTARRLARVAGQGGSEGSVSIRQRLSMALHEARRQGSASLAADVSGSVFLRAEDLAAVRMPVRLWYGGADRITGCAGGRWLAERLPEARSRRLPGGYLFFLRCQPLLFATIRELARADSPAAGHNNALVRKWSLGRRDVAA